MIGVGVKIMTKFYCNRCKLDVELVNDECPQCGTNWQKIINNSISKEKDDINESIIKNKIINNDDKEKKDNRDIKSVYNFFHDYAVFVKYAHFFFAFIAFITIFIHKLINVFIILGHMFLASLLIFCGILLENIFKWKSYMLKINYEISKNTKK